MIKIVNITDYFFRNIDNNLKENDKYETIEEYLNKKYLEILFHLNIPKEDILLQTIFLKCTNNRDYFFQKEKIIRKMFELFTTKENESDEGDVMPPISIVSQTPINVEQNVDHIFGMEIMFVNDHFKNNFLPTIVRKKIKVNNNDDVIYYCILEYNNNNYEDNQEIKNKQLFIGGLNPVTIHFCDNNYDNIHQCYTEVFEQLNKIFEIEEFTFSDIVRQWNYIENIHGFTMDVNQNYQIFNEIRSQFYAKDDENFQHYGYPAATGIGTHAGILNIDLIAIKKTEDILICPLKNFLQTDAHQYDREVLILPASHYYNDKNQCFKKYNTPKFERGKLVCFKNSEFIIFVSGTASIQNQESLFINDIEKQFITIQENINFLVSNENINHHLLQLDDKKCIQINEDIPLLFDDLNYLRIYIKREFDIPLVIKNLNHYLKKQCNDHKKIIFLIADICRPELLIEMEGYLK